MTKLLMQRFPNNNKIIYNSSDYVAKQIKAIYNAVGGSMKIYIWRASFVNGIIQVVVLLLILVCHTVGNTHSINCSTLDDPLPIPHKFHQPGDLVIGEIVSQVYFHYNNLSFEEQPIHVLIDEPM